MLTRQTTGLIVVDIQGKLARIVHESEVLISNCSKLIKGAQVLRLPIVQLEQNPEKLGPTVDELNTLLDTVPHIAKFSFSACEEPAFVEAIKSYDVDTWLICGIEAHICVYQTARGLAKLGYKVEVVRDCVSSRLTSNKQLGLDKLTRHGIELTGLEMCLYELIKDCRAPEFKPVLDLIR
ncbi:hydrolase [Oleiphilus sp. HI0130]|jgi:nicotinamidase-related amidase|nr:hydrolase [Oleiphilus sp. HI0130]